MEGVVLMALLIIVLFSLSCFLLSYCIVLKIKLPFLINFKPV